jgi:hypothetical protein
VRVAARVRRLGRTAAAGEHLRIILLPVIAERIGIRHDGRGHLDEGGLIGRGGRLSRVLRWGTRTGRTAAVCLWPPSQAHEGVAPGVASPKDLAERAAPLLPSGSHVRQAFVCQTAPYFALFLINWATGLAMFWITYRCVAVAEDAIYVLDGPKLPKLWGGAKPTSIAGKLPRHTQLGPVSGRWGQTTLLGERHWVKRRFHAEIAAADAEAGFMYGR